MVSVGDNQQALEKTITALEGLSDEHAALIEHARTLATEIDVGDESDAKTHSEYRQVLKMLLDVGKKKGIDNFERLLRELRGEED